MGSSGKGKSEQRDTLSDVDPPGEIPPRTNVTRTSVL
jgi:hypothetical protein